MIISQIWDHVSCFLIVTFWSQLSTWLGAALNARKDLLKLLGLSLHLNLMWMEDDCDWNKFFYTSKEVKSDNPEASPFEINYRAIIATREIGKGFTGLSNSLLTFAVLWIYHHQWM